MNKYTHLLRVFHDPAVAARSVITSVSAGLSTLPIVICSITSTTVVLVTASQNVEAQEQRLLEEITVTARKREEKALDIPESISTISDDLIEKANITGLGDIGLQIPNLYMNRRLDGFPNASIRGIGGFGNTQGVGFYLDNVQLFSDASSRFGDLERIEVLKGPQGVLYGGANIGGAVRFVTKKPNPEEFSGRVKAKVGEDDYYDGEVQVNIPLAEEWAMILYGFGMTDDSYLVNPNSPRINGGVNNNDPDIGKTEEYGFRASISGNITDRFSVYGTVRYNELDGPNNVWSVENDGNLTHTNRVDTSFNPRHKRETVAGSLELNYEFDSFDVATVTSYTDTDSDRESDLDITQEFILDLFRPHRLDVFTQEIRFTSTDNSPLQWQMGGYYLDYERDMDSELLARGGFGFLDPTTGLPVPPPLNASESALVVALPFEDSLRERRQIAGFANFSYRWSNFELAGGIRVDNWKSERVNRSSNISGQQEETEVLGRASVAWHFDNDQSMIYGTFSQGFEPGDFNLTNFAGANTLFGYGPETVDQVEIGYKGTIRNQIVLSLAGFYINYDDRQFELQASDPAGGFVEGIINAGDSTHWGFEGNVAWSLHENWTFSAGLGYVDAEWDDGTISPVTGRDISGLTPPNTAKWSTSISLDYDRRLNSDSRLFGRLQMRHKGDSSTNAQFFDAPGDAFPFWENPSFVVVGLHLGMEWRQWEFGLHVENLFDEEYYIDVQEFPNFAGSARAGTPGNVIIGTLEQPRRVFGSVQYRF